MTFGRAIILAILAQWGLEWLTWSYPPSTALGQWSVVAARAAVYVPVGVVAARRRSWWWRAPLAALGAALVATLALVIVGILTGQFLARGMGPALVAAYLVSSPAFGALAGVSIAAGARWLGRRSAVQTPVA